MSVLGNNILLGDKKALINSLNVTENGTYAASGEVNGFSPVVVNVPTSGLKKNVESMLNFNEQIILLSTAECKRLWNVNFYNYDETYMFTEHVEDGEDCVKGAFGSWSTTPGGTAIPGITTNIHSDLNLYATEEYSYVHFECTVSGGLNGGATIVINADNTQIFTSTANDTYNRHYNNTHAEVDVGGGRLVVIDVTPPPSNTGILNITVSMGMVESMDISPVGDNTSWGYNYSNTFELY